MNFFKKLVIVFPIFFVTKFVQLTSLVSFIGTENKEKAKSISSSKAYIMAIWHETLLMGLLAHVRDEFVPMVSKSKDGQLVAFLLRLFGKSTIEGSSSRGALKAVKKLSLTLKKGTWIGITIDGPRGPRHVPKAGLFHLAYSSNAAILPMICLWKHSFTFKKTWDQFKFPLPFSKAVVVYGNPMIISKENHKNFNDLQEAYHQEMIRIHQIATNHMNS